MSSLQGALVELFTPEEKSETEAAMIADGVHLQALPLERLRYYGCREKRLPVAVGNCFLEGEDGYDDDFYVDEAYKMAARKEAQLRIRTRCRRIPCWRSLQGSEPLSA
jgi:hypothetical protein